VSGQQKTPLGLVWEVYMKKSIFLLLLFLAGNTLAGCKPEDLMNILFSEPKRFSTEKDGNTVVQSSSDDNQRGHAQELQPDIALPPPAGATTAQPSDTLLDKQKLGSLIGELEHMASSGQSQTQTDAFPDESFRPTDSANKIKWLPPPPGFMTADTYNYLIYREDEPVTAKVKTLLDDIHGNLMLDLTPFTLVLKPNKILVMLFDKRQSYMDYTKRPAWSGAASDLRSDSIYLVEEKGVYPLTIHEMTHLYFDGYFLPSISPLWLSEGMAVYMQVLAGKQRPSWIDKSMRLILQENALIPFEEMMSVQTLKNYPQEQAELWYTQAYSVVDYLLNKRSRDEFYRFCNELKSQTPVYQALYRAYGMPFNKVSALESAWLHDLTKAYQQGRLNQAISPAPATAAAPVPQAQTNQQPTVATKPVSQPPAKTQIKQMQLVDPDFSKGFF
jgi:hypothetical protein